MKASDETVRQVWEDLVETDRMARYYGYLAQRLDRLGDLLQIGSVGAASGRLCCVTVPVTGLGARRRHRRGRGRRRCRPHPPLSAKGG